LHSNRGKKSILFYSLIRVVSTTVTVCGLEVKKGLFQHSAFLGPIKLHKKSIKKAALSNSLPKPCGELAKENIRGMGKSQTKCLCGGKRD